MMRPFLIVVVFTGVVASACASPTTRPTTRPTTIRVVPKGVEVYQRFGAGPPPEVFPADSWKKPATRPAWQAAMMRSATTSAPLDPNEFPEPDARTMAEIYLWWAGGDSWSDERRKTELEILAFATVAERELDDRRPKGFLAFLSQGAVEQLWRDGKLAALHAKVTDDQGTIVGTVFVPKPIPPEGQAAIGRDYYYYLKWLNWRTDRVLVCHEVPDTKVVTTFGAYTGSGYQPQ